jgi:hypothetical protein
MLIATIAAVAGLLFICWVLFTLAVYALPFFLAVSLGTFAYQTGAGALGATLVGLISGVLALVLGQAAFAATRTPAVRSTIAAVYAVPAAIAGYHAVHGFAALGSPTEIWREVLSIIGALVVAAVTWGRMGALAR